MSILQLKPPSAQISSDFVTGNSILESFGLEKNTLKLSRKLHLHLRKLTGGLVNGGLSKQGLKPHVFRRRLGGSRPWKFGLLMADSRPDWSIVFLMFGSPECPSMLPLWEEQQNRRRFWKSRQWAPQLSCLGNKIWEPRSHCQN